MRLTREMLLRVAQETADRQARQERDLIAAYLGGSILHENYLLGGTADVDLFFIHAEPHPVEREVVRLTEEVHLDIAHHSQRDYRDPRQLRVHPWVGPTLFSCKTLYDPQHFLDFIQASVRGQYDRPDHVLERARVQAEQARQIWWGLRMTSPEPEPAIVREYLRAVGLAANAVASLSGPPLAERRLLIDFASRAAALDRPGLYHGLLGLLGGPRLDSQALEGWLPHWQTAYESLPASQSPVRLHPFRFHYYYKAFGEMIQSEKPETALWLLLTTWTLLANLAPQGAAVRQAWYAAVQHLGFTGAEFPQRLAALDAYLDLIEETLESWALEYGA